ncbi:MAG TPA: chemotaxis protein CheB, partial [Candidatus Sulfotelmatobacter sp.]|nr:chemotaxis protein CheB [Candidatus Sulfotelmatobacter sp.]
MSQDVPAGEPAGGGAEPHPSPEPRQPRRPGVPVVGLGASAGGLAALEAFFRALPSDPGMVFVVVQHLDPGHRSILIELIQRHTQMPVAQATDQMAVEANRVYVIPPNRDLALLHGRLHLFEPTAPRGLRLPIDFFFRTLAQDQREQAIGIVLSGTGTDGTLGLKAIKGEGGLALVQSPESAEYDGMPRSALATGVADAILPPTEMPERLLAYAQRAFGDAAGGLLSPVLHSEGDLQKVCVVLRAQTGHDFSQYKPSALGRRVARRMAVAQLDRLDEYLRYLQTTPAEADALFRDLLIGVTSFFRDPDAFAVLTAQVIPRLVARAREQPLRVWVPACATGEEAYSLAMLLQEGLDLDKRPPGRIQVYATDLDAAAIDTARGGLYPESIAADVSPERLARFFIQEEHAYRVTRAIRDVVIFAAHDVLSDPPFSRLDLVSCRNLLIYLNADLQQKLAPIFHYALQPGGYLWLGPAESIDAGDLFGVVDRRWKIYQRRPGLAGAFATGLAPRREMAHIPPRAGRKAEPGVREVTEQALLQDYAPAAALVTSGGDVLYVHGRTGRYLELAPGDARMDLPGMAREGLRLPLGAALHKAATSRAPVRYEHVRVQTNGDTALVNLVVRPVVRADGPVLFLVLFEEADPEVPSGPLPAPAADAEQRLAEIEQQLGAKEAYLQATVEELHAANEELHSTNEELQAGNEELQSTNEELETAKEELQALNEELQTVNAELQQNVAALGQANNDMANLLAGTGIATIFVGQDLHIRRFTPAATQILRLIGTDVGRPISDLASHLVGYPSLVEDVRKVLDILVPIDGQVQTQDGRCFAMRLQPYRTQQNVIEGAVLTFVDITAQRTLQDQLQDAIRGAEKAQAYAEAMLETIHEPVLVLDGA